MFQNISFERNKVNGIDSDEEEELDERIDTPKSVRGNSFLKRTTVKIPLKDDKTTNTKRSGTPTAVNKLTKYQSRNSTPLKKRYSDNDREDTLIREAKLISDDNELAYGSPGRSFLKPITKSPFSFEKSIGSPPSFKIKPADVEKSGGIEVTVKNSDIPKQQEVMEDIEFESAGSDDDIQGPSLQNNNFKETVHQEPPMQRSPTQVQSNSPRISVRHQSPAFSDRGPRISSTFGNLSPAPSVAPRPVSSQERNAPHRGISTVDPQIRDSKKNTRETHKRTFSRNVQERSSSRHVSPPAPSVRSTSPQIIERAQTSPQFKERPNNIASSVEAESISTTIDKGSLQVGIPSRIEVEHDRAEIMEKIDPRMSFEDNEIDLESGISSDDNAAQLLNELDSFLPKSSPNKLNFTNGRQWNGTTNGNSNGRDYGVRGLNGLDNSSINRARINRRPLNSTTPELTPIRKHYGRLNERFARHLNNKRKQERKSELATQFELTESEKLEIPEPESPEEEAEQEEQEEENQDVWTNHKWRKLNKLIMCGKFTIQDILNSQVSTKWFQCKNKEDLKQRIEFLIQFNEYRIKKN
ncbi:hypothetical protein CLIB1444_05S02344 [[Candida] jaroonii]|uniref:Uncharacterized protein n=1 Tax=[Candida] jaroonii TaxID=467808 RepID=A0ACA9Y839_9ASCO|nr:hypothetical protein CLIB1444_05S02344 [[Candida] jaroonii]